LSKTDIPDTEVKAPTTFQKGLSGNPKGRPPGSKGKLTLLREALMQDSEEIMVRHFPRIVDAVVQKAMQGDMVAAKMIMDRMIPTKKAIEFSGKDGQDFGIKIIVQQIGNEIENEIKTIDGEYEDE